MTIDHNAPRTSAVLRYRAERLARHGEEGAEEQLEALAPETLRHTLHELRVHQIELEMQNDELQRVQAELFASRERYLDLYDHAPVGYLTLTGTGTVANANVTAANMFGVERSQLIQQALTGFVHPDDQDSFYLLRKALLANPERQTSELRMTRADGSHFWARLEATLAPGQQEHPAFRIVLSDVTERHASEEERLALQEQLLQAQKLEAIGTLAGGVAHDFNNILSGLQGGLTFLELELGESTERVKTDIDEMKLLVDRAANLTRQLLGFARRGKYDVKPLDLVTVASKTLQMFARTRKDLVVRFTSPPELPSVLMDHTQLEQVLLNLFINAGQAMTEGGSLSVTAEPADAPAADGSPPPPTGNYVRVVVSDTGRGMDAATQARVFEPFFTTKARGCGTGLGLASVYGIMQSHGGQVAVESTIGQGTSFTLFLPANGPLSPPSPATADNVVHRGTGTILLVDDEEQILKTCSRLLVRIGYEVLIAPSGEAALELLREHRERISLVILDMVMPHMSGSQAFDAMRTLVPGIRVLLCSGYSADGQAKSLLDRGCNGFLQKPFNLATLSAKVLEALS